MVAQELGNSSFNLMKNIDRLIWLFRFCSVKPSKSLPDAVYAVSSQFAVKT